MTVVSDETAPQEQRLGPEVGQRLAGWLEDHGVEMMLGAQVESITPGADSWAVRLSGARVLTADAVVLGTGVRPRLALAEEAGLEIEAGAVATDASFRTSTEGVLAWVTSPMRGTLERAAGCGPSTGGRP